MIVIPAAAKQRGQDAHKAPEIEQPHLVLTALSAVLLLAGLGLFAASL